jgi:ArsR family transcriptional regulator
MTTPAILSRKLGERCCDPAAPTTMTFDQAAEVAAQAEVLAHPVRLVLLDVLAQSEGPVCVCDLEASVPVKQPTVSHHLRLLRQAGLVTSEKVGVWAYYRVDTERLESLRQQLSDRLAAFAKPGVVTP